MESGQGTELRVITTVNNLGKNCTYRQEFLLGEQRLLITNCLRMPCVAGID
jgi:hypothetical protein